MTSGEIEVKVKMFVKTINDNGEEYIKINDIVDIKNKGYLPELIEALDENFKNQPVNQ